MSCIESETSTQLAIFQDVCLAAAGNYILTTLEICVSLNKRLYKLLVLIFRSYMLDVVHSVSSNAK